MSKNKILIFMTFMSWLVTIGSLLTFWVAQIAGMKDASLVLQKTFYVSMATGYVFMLAHLS